MRIDLGLVLAIVIEYILFVFYADTLFYRKRNKYICYLIIAAGFVLHFICCMFGNIIFNAITSITVNFLCFVICYHVNYKNAIFQSALLVALCAATESLVVFVPYLGFVPTETTAITSIQSMILTLVSRALYLVGVMLLSRIFCRDKQRQIAPTAGLVIIPMLDICVVLMLLKTSIASGYLAVSCLVLMITNIIVFIINQKMISKEYEISELKEQLLKEQVDFEEHMLLKEKYQEMKIFHHDFQEHINTLSALIDSDNEQAKQYIQSFREEEISSQFVDYSDNKILNVLLSKNKIECQANGIKFVIDPIQASLSFIKDMDVVSIFSNLLNNAIESCKRSDNKTIFLNISTQKDIFIVIRLENTADEKPIIIDGKLKTHKYNEELHGIGMNSIRRALKKYNGYLKWDYDEKQKIFSTIVIIKGA